MTVLGTQKVPRKIYQVRPFLQYASCPQKWKILMGFFSEKEDSRWESCLSHLVEGS